MGNKEQLLEQMRNAAIVIDHGYDGNRQGYTAQAVAVEIPGRSIHVMTAGHNGEHITIFDPETNRQSHEPFDSYPPDIGISQRPYPENLREREPLKAGEIPANGDTVLLLSIRHQGDGKFVEHTIEGTITEPMEDPYDHQVYPSFVITSGQPALGDSGAMVVPMTRNGVPQETAELIGVYRGGTARGRISPIPYGILKLTQEADSFYS